MHSILKLLCCRVQRDGLLAHMINGIGCRTWNLRLFPTGFYLQCAFHLFLADLKKRPMQVPGGRSTNGGRCFSSAHFRVGERSVQTYLKVVGRRLPEATGHLDFVCCRHPNRTCMGHTCAQSLTSMDVTDSHPSCFCMLKMNTNAPCERDQKSPLKFVYTSAKSIFFWGR